jgi:hypothetical protein
MKAAGAPRRPGVKPLADLVAGLVDPILAKKAGMTSGLVTAWPEIAGPRLAAGTRPEKLIWQARRSDNDPFEPATLVVACEGASALRLQHESGELLQRIDAFFGFHAVGRLKIVQKALPLPPVSRKPATAQLSATDKAAIEAQAASVENERLRKALTRLGESVLSRNRAPKG